MLTSFNYCIIFRLKLIILDIILWINFWFSVTLFEVRAIKEKWSSMVAVTEENRNKEFLFQLITRFGAIKSQKWLLKVLIWFLDFTEFKLFLLLLLIVFFFFSFNFFIFILFSIFSQIFRVKWILLVILHRRNLLNIRRTHTLV